MNMNSYTNTPSHSLGKNEFGQASELFLLLSESNRLLLLSFLEFGSQSVSELVLQSQLSQSLVSHHLKDLKIAGLVTSLKEKQWVYYSLSEKGKQVIEMVRSIG